MNGGFPDGEGTGGGDGGGDGPGAGASLTIGAFARAARLSPKALRLYDELDLPLGTLRVRERGSPAGHNGARSISGTLGTDEWKRIRMPSWRSGS